VANALSIKKTNNHLSGGGRDTDNKRRERSSWGSFAAGAEKQKK